MIKGLLLAAACAFALVTTTAGAAARSDEPTRVQDLSLELVGEVINSAPGVTPATSIQYGYLAYLRGLPIFDGTPQNESTALFTFYTETTTTRVIVHGPLRVISREGTVTVYRDPAANASFASPDSFRDGTPVLVAGLRQQVIVNTTTGSFSAMNMNTITAVTPFSTGSGELELGDVGGRFKTILSGQLNSPGPPSGYMAGYTTSVGDPTRNKR